ncbi:hypothetical protein AXF42_Ash009530 [Apostasia shenzhenica]|uniref:Uncharacterized protein n=1 Tax=Apostasia shenzhenica TaxID=1088818 RepID=A0A2I0B959_9ASPA|nr:hypothetical protein AXF42_Ash009530 [Apostasia shenzhenica]
MAALSRWRSAVCGWRITGSLRPSLVPSQLTSFREITSKLFVSGMLLLPTSNLCIFRAFLSEGTRTLTLLVYCFRCSDSPNMTAIVPV